MVDEQDTATRAACSLRELVGDDEHRRRQSLIEAIGIAEFASAEWTAVVSHVRLMREDRDRFVVDKKRLDRELAAAQAESFSWKQAHAELNADLQAKSNDLDFRRRQMCMATGVREDSTWEHALADLKEQRARVTAAHEAGVKMWRESAPSRDMQLPPTRTDLVTWMLTRIEELEREYASEVANIKRAFSSIEIELCNELRAVRGALQARDDEAALDAAKRWVSTAMNEAALLNDIDEARGMLCGELVINDPGSTVEVMRQAALAIARHRLSTEALSKIRAELAAAEAKSLPHGSGVTDPRLHAPSLPQVLTPKVLRGLRAMACALTVPQAEHPDVRAACEWLVASSAPAGDQAALDPPPSLSPEQGAALERYFHIDSGEFQRRVIRGDEDDHLAEMIDAFDAFFAMCRAKLGHDRVPIGIWEAYTMIKRRDALVGGSHG